MNLVNPTYYTTMIDMTMIIYYTDDGRGDYNRSYERSNDEFDYADYSTDHRDNNYRNFEKKRKKSDKEIIEDLLKKWD